MGSHSRTIVGGRASGSEGRKNYPHGIEILLKKAKVSPPFSRLLLRDAFRAAESIELELTESERKILANTPPSILNSMIARTFVPRHHVRSFLTQNAPALLLLVIASTVALEVDAGGSKGETVTASSSESMRDEAVSKMGVVQAALEQYRKEHDSYPTTEQWLTVTNPLEGYIETSYLFDPWKRKFHYESPAAAAGNAESYRLESLGLYSEDPRDDIPCPIDPGQHSFSKSK